MSCNKIKSLRLQRSSQRSQPSNKIEDMSMILAEETKTHVERIELSSRGRESPTRLHSTPKRSAEKSSGTRDQGAIDYHVSPILLPCTQDGGNDVAWDWQSPLAKSKLKGNKAAEQIGTPKRTSMLQKKRNSNSPLLYKPTKRKLLRNDQESIDKFTAEMKAISEQFKTVPRGEDDFAAGPRPGESSDELLGLIEADDFVEAAAGVDENSARKNGRTVVSVPSMDDLFDDSIEDSMVKCSQEVEEKLRLEACRESSSSSKRNSDTSASGKDSPPSWHQNSYSRFLTARDKTPDDAGSSSTSAYRPKTSSSSTGNFSGDAGTTPVISNQTKPTSVTSNQSTLTSGTSNPSKSTSGISYQPKLTSGISSQSKTSGFSNQSKLTSGISDQPKLTSRISNQSNSTSGISSHSKPTPGISLQQKSTSGISLQQKSTSGISLPQNSTSGISLQQKSTSGISLPQKSTSGISLPQKSTSEISIPQKPSCINNNVTSKPVKTSAISPPNLPDVFEIPDDSFDDFICCDEPEPPASKIPQESPARYGKFYTSPHSSSSIENPKTRPESSSARRVLLPPPSQSKSCAIVGNSATSFSSSENSRNPIKSSMGSQPTTSTTTTTATNQGRKFFKTKSLSTSSFEDLGNVKNAGDSSLGSRGWKNTVFANGSANSCVSSNGKTTMLELSEVFRNGDAAANRVGGVNVDRNGRRNDADSRGKIATQSANVCTPEEIERKRLEAKTKLEAKRRLLARSSSSGSLARGFVKR